MTNAERERAIQLLKYYGEKLGCKSEFDLAIKALEDRPQGEWIDYNKDFYKCPECGYLLNKSCPHCHNKLILPNS